MKEEPMLLQLYTNLIFSLSFYESFNRDRIEIFVKLLYAYKLIISRDFPNKLGNICASDIVECDLPRPENSANVNFRVWC